MDKYFYARIAYQAYGKAVDFKNFRGGDMPSFDDLPEAIKNAWFCAAEALLFPFNEDEVG